ncbi:aldo/keto reductase [Frankia sp. Cas4]|uniref:aldo/keto reductase n=1 Tax=Frankia sp. Cas4 TaxID=3073927 RepID=UPI002AD232D1|nr:aldo/keto reductase [Frankia sp. Cas4]
MRTRRIGSLEVSVVGLGCNQLGTTCDETRTAAILDTAVDNGVTFLDTADEYGAGASEELLGRLLAARRDKVVIATKFGSTYGAAPGDGGASPRWITAAVEASLRRLRTDRIDLYQLHFPDPTVPIEETLGALDALVQAGKVREIGCANVGTAQIDEAARAAKDHGLRPFVSVQNRLNLLRPEALADTVPAASAHGMAFLPFFPLASGVLTGKYRRGQAPPEGTRLGDHVAPDVVGKILSDRTHDRLEAFEKLAGQDGHSLLELSIAWLIAQPAVASVIAGVTSPAQLLANVAAAEWELSEDTAAAVSALTHG